MNIVVMMTMITILMTYYATKNYLIQRSSTDKKFCNGHIVNAQLTADKSIIQEELAKINGTERQDSTVNGENLTNVQGNTDKTYSTMLKLISGALVGGTN